MSRFKGPSVQRKKIFSYKKCDGGSRNAEKYKKPSRNFRTLSKPNFDTKRKLKLIFIVFELQQIVHLSA